MKRFVFINTHLYSGSNYLVSLLNKHPRIKINDSNLNFDHPSLIYDLFKNQKKFANKSIIDGEIIYYNYSISNKRFLDFCYFIHLINRPEPSISLMVEKSNFTYQRAFDYYCFRLRRICENLYYAPKSLIFLYENIDLNKIQEFFEFPEPINYFPLKEIKYEPIPYDLKVKSEKVFERYWHWIKNFKKNI